MKEVQQHLDHLRAKLRVAEQETEWHMARRTRHKIAEPNRDYLELGIQLHNMFAVPREGKGGSTDEQPSRGSTKRRDKPEKGNTG